MRRTILILALLATTTLPACSGESATPECDTPVATTEVELADFEFRPVCVEVPADQSLILTNTGGAPHTYTVRDTDVHVNLDAGETGQASLAGLAPGTLYAVTCTYHPQMVGALKIV